MAWSADYKVFLSGKWTYSTAAIFFAQTAYLILTISLDGVARLLCRAYCAAAPGFEPTSLQSVRELHQTGTFGTLY